MDRRMLALAGATAVAALAVSPSQADFPAPRERVLLTVGQLVTVSALCPWTGDDTVVLANARRSASDLVHWRVGGGTWRHAQLDPGHRLAISVPAVAQTKRFRAHTLTPVLEVRFEQPREPHTITANVRTRIGIDPSNGHRPECTLVGASVSATTAFHG
jgi:hypothetical protein